MRLLGLSSLLPFLFVVLSFPFPPIHALSLAPTTSTYSLLLAVVLPSLPMVTSWHMPGHCIHFPLNPFRCKYDSSIPVIDGISQKLLDRMKLMSQYAAAAYCPGNNDSPGTLVRCPPGNCPLVEKHRVKTLDEFENTAAADDTGFISVDNWAKEIVLSFRGTQSMANWHQNLKVLRVHTGWCHKCNAHQGFWEGWQQVRKEVIEIVVLAVKTYPDYRFVVVGHSLGAAIATLAAGEIRQINSHLRDITELFTFGSPRLGNAHLVKFLSEQSKLSYRITSTNDPIPRLPSIIMGYMHTTPEYWIHDHPMNPSRNDISVVSGYYSEKGNTGQLFRLNIDPHSKYFGPIVKCNRVAQDNSPWRRDSDPLSTLDSAVSSVRHYPLGLAWDILRPHVNTSILTTKNADNPNDELKMGIVFPPGSVSDVAAEAVYGPAGTSGNLTVPLHEWIGSGSLVDGIEA